ncbi:MFS transporter [bacterium]|nr:MFS transporter [bacterium]
MKRVRLWTRNFALITIITFLVFMNHVMVLTTFPFYVETLGGKEAIAGLAATLFSVVAVISRPAIGWVLDNGKRRAILITGIIGMAIMPIGYLAASILALALIFRMLHGAFMSCAGTASSTVATDIIPKERFGEGMGIFSTSIALSTCFAPALGLLLMNRFGYSALYGASAGMLVIAFALYFMMKIPPVHIEKKPLRLKQLVAADALPSSTVILFFLLNFGAVENFIAKFAASVPELPSGGLFFIIMSCVLILTRVLLGKAIDRHGEAFFVYSGNFTMFMASILLAIHPNKVAFVIAAVLAGYGFGGMQPALQTMAVRNVSSERRGAANSTFLCTYDIGIGIGGGIAGWLISALGYAQMFAITTVFLVLSVAAYLFWGRNHPSAFTNCLKSKS